VVYSEKKRHGLISVNREQKSNAIGTILRPQAKRIGIIADTHIPDRSKEIHPKIMESFARADLILHAGDITVPDVIGTLSTIAETVAVRGNNRSDRTLFDPPLPDKAIIQVAGGYRIGLCHGMENIYQRVSDALIGRMGFESHCTKRLIERVRTFFIGVNAVVYGHGHWPMLCFKNQILFVNPGKGFGKKCSSCAFMEIHENRVRVKIIPLSPFKNPLPFNPDWNEFPIDK
jgi:putative phosphoesterase